MPKKFKGENSKAAAARERKSAAREAEESLKKKKEEDEYWRDDDKLVAKKQERKADKERKRVEQLERKQAAKKLLEEEDSKLKGKTGGGGATAKVTRAQIQEAEERRRSEGACALPKGVTGEPELEANPNHLLREQQEQGEEAARTVDEAIDLLRLPSQEKVDMHPEKRLKAAYAVFEERELPRLKAENPNLRLSQVKQLLRKEWMKSPDNPMNQL